MKGVRVVVLINLHDVFAFITNNYYIIWITLNLFLRSRPRPNAFIPLITNQTAEKNSSQYHQLTRPRIYGKLIMQPILRRSSFKAHRLCNLFYSPLKKKIRDVKNGKKNPNHIL